MKHICFIFPNENVNCGGYIIQYDIFNILKKYYEKYNIIIIKKKECKQFISQNIKDIKNWYIIIFWGPIVNYLLDIFKNWNIIYWAHSCGYDLQNLSNDIPIICVSRNTMSYYGSTTSNPLYLLYSPINIKNNNFEKSIDILIQERKNSSYIMNKLLPVLMNINNIKIKIIKDWIPTRQEYIDILSSSKIYIYDSKEYWNSNNLTEGFGIPPVEALLNKCIVFSSLNHALSDILDPLNNCFQVTGILHVDLKNIKYVIKNYTKVTNDFDFDVSDMFSKKIFINKFKKIINNVDLIH
jgi:hypothetical protein